MKPELAVNTQSARRCTAKSSSRCIAPQASLFAAVLFRSLLRASPNLPFRMRIESEVTLNLPDASSGCCIVTLKQETYSTMAHRQSFRDQHFAADPYQDLPAACALISHGGDVRISFSESHFFNDALNAARRSCSAFQARSAITCDCAVGALLVRPRSTKSRTSFGTSMPA